MRKPPKPKALRPPGHLKEAGSKLWQNIVEHYDFEADSTGSLHILRVVCEATDRLAECQAIIALEGLTIEDRFAKRQAHPLLTVEKAARQHVLQGLKQLGLSDNPSDPPRMGRPPSKHPII